MNVADPALYASNRHLEAFKRLRAEDPVHYCAESPYGPYWSVARYDDITRVDLNPRVYSSAAGGISIYDQEAPSTPSFIAMDPPEHRTHRARVTPVFSSANLASLEAEIRARVAGLLDRIVPGEPFDWVRDIANELPLSMLSTLFGVPESDRYRMLAWSNHILARTDGRQPVRARSEGESFSRYFIELLERRRREPPGFDLVSHLVHGPGGDTLSVDEYLSDLKLLVVGANDTTRTTIAGGLLAVCEQPGCYDALRSAPALLDTAVDEIVRFVTPVLHQRRTALADTELNGKQIRAGDKVVMWYVSGNRDETAFADADSLVLDRREPRPLSFGSGIHHCIGFRLARLQVRSLWEQLLERFSRIEVVGPVARTPSNFVQGYLSMPVVARR